MYILCIYRLITEYMGDLADQDLCICFPCFVHISFEKTQKDFLLFLNNFVGIFTLKPSRDLTRPLGSPRGLKGLLHTVNAIVIATTVSQDFLFFYFHFFLVSLVYFTRGRAKSWCGSICLSQKCDIFKVLFHQFYARFNNIFQVFN